MPVVVHVGQCDIQVQVGLRDTSVTVHVQAGIVAFVGEHAIRVTAHELTAEVGNLSSPMALAL
jgi:hypothetical protein